MPSDARHLIESVYGEDAQENIPSELEQLSFEAEAKQKAQKGMGEFNQLKLDKGYTLSSAVHNGGWSEDVHIPTRLSGNDTVAVVFVRKTSEGWLPYASSNEYAWALSQINLPKREWERAHKLIPNNLRESLEQFKQQVPALRWLELIPLVEETNSFYNPKGGWLGVIENEARG